MTRLALALCLFSVLLTGCTTQRTLPRVKEVGDRAYRDGRWEEARAEYQEYVDRKPGEPEVQMKLARSLVELHRAPEAVSIAAVACDAQPNNPEAIETYALALSEAKRTEQLFQLLNSNCDKRGDVADFDRLGRYELKMGDPDSALKAFKRAAIADAGKNPGPQLALAQFYKSIGDKPSEIRRLRMALSRDPSNPDIYLRLKELGEIPGPSLALTPEEATDSK